VSGKELISANNAEVFNIGMGDHVHCALHRITHPVRVVSSRCRATWVMTTSAWCLWRKNAFRRISQ